MRKTHDVGRFREKATVVFKEVTIDDFGMESEEYKLKYNLYVQRIALSTSEITTLIADNKMDLKPIKLATRYRKDISESDYVLYNGTVYNIRNVDFDIDNPYMELLLEKVV